MDLVDTVNGLVISIAQIREICELQDQFINGLKVFMTSGETKFYYALQEQFPILFEKIKELQTKHEFEKTMIKPDGVMTYKSIKEVREKYGLNKNEEKR